MKLRFHRPVPSGTEARVPFVAFAARDPDPAQGVPRYPGRALKRNKIWIGLQVEQSKRKGVADKFGELAPAEAGMAS
jgi:acyl dehydratase